MNESPSEGNSNLAGLEPGRLDHAAARVREHWADGAKSLGVLLAAWIAYKVHDIYAEGAERYESFAFFVVVTLWLVVLLAARAFEDGYVDAALAALAALLAWVATLLFVQGDTDWVFAIAILIVMMGTSALAVHFAKTPPSGKRLEASADHASDRPDPTRESDTPAVTTVDPARFNAAREQLTRLAGDSSDTPLTVRQLCDRGSGLSVALVDGVLREAGYLDDDSEHLTMLDEIDLAEWLRHAESASSSEVTSDA